MKIWNFIWKYSTFQDSERVLLYKQSYGYGFIKRQSWYNDKSYTLRVSSPALYSSFDLWRVLYATCAGLLVSAAWSGCWFYRWFEFQHLPSSGCKISGVPRVASRSSVLLNSRCQVAGGLPNVAGLTSGTKFFTQNNFEIVVFEILKLLLFF